MNTRLEAAILIVCLILATFSTGAVGFYLWSLKGLKADYANAVADNKAYYQAKVEMLNWTVPVDDPDGYNSRSRGFFCFVTRNKTAEQIARLDVHESCHALLAVNYTHFCAGK